MSSAVFFSGIAQEELRFREHAAKAPLFYQDVHMMSGVFLGDLKVARSLLPTARHYPLRPLPNRAVVAVHCMQYRASDIGPYNEVALSVGIAYGDKPVLGPTALLRAALSGQYQAHVAALPVTTEIALWGGIDVFGFPKYRANIEIEQGPGWHACTLRDLESNELIVRIEGDAISTNRIDQSSRERLKTQTLTSFPRKDDLTLRARMVVNLIESGTSYGRSHMWLTIGSHERSRVLRDLRLGPQIQYVFAPRCQAILYRPEPCEEP